jgi:hypothetical protein
MNAMTFNPALTSWYVHGSPVCGVTCTKLIAGQAWFQCEPLSGEWYRFTLKRDAADMLRPPIARDQPTW